ncbi:hypothetical protein ELI20_37000 [Rhizobium ruizarguesonis]|uniref:hypothetical protein n=1 Tax=Rhizobium ruizarguesonis TaxID=2081791 RepID=UPI00102FADC1|nr:hypothetical protein [Rhizobium ruizarguesonis]TAW04062.1 hypothetical protein ELI20_37000 [Rhizobium ruizarguesonis]
MFGSHLIRRQYTLSQPPWEILPMQSKTPGLGILSSVAALALILNAEIAFAEDTSRSHSITPGEQAFVEAIRQNDLPAALTLAEGAIKVAQQKASTSPSDLALWHNRAGYVNILMDSEPEAKQHYDAACGFANQIVQAVEQRLECEIGSAFADFYNSGGEKGKEIAAAKREEIRDPIVLILAELVIGTSALLEEKPVSAESVLDDALHTLETVGPANQPQLATMIANAYVATGNLFASANQSIDDGRVKFKALDVQAAAIGKESLQLLPTLETIALSDIGDEGARTVAKWRIELAFIDPDHEQARKTFASAVKDLARSNARDDALVSLWKWQARAESQFGVQSVEAGQSLVLISDFMFQQADYENGNKLRDRALSLIESKLGNESEIYIEASKSIEYQTYQANQKVLSNLKNELEKLAIPDAGVPTTIPHLGPAGDETPTDNDEATPQSVVVDAQGKPAQPREYCDGLKQVVEAGNSHFDKILGPKRNDSWVGRTQLTGWYECSISELTEGDAATRYYSCSIEPFQSVDDVASTLGLVAADVQACLGDAWIKVDGVNSKGLPRVEFASDTSNNVVELRISANHKKIYRLSIDINQP